MTLKKYIGNKQFYIMLLTVTVPIMVQSGITNFVSMLDNIMIGQIGTDQMSGVAIANQLIFVFNVCIFGGLSGAGIFGAQFYGNGDVKGVRNTFRFKLIICALITVFGIALMLLFDKPLISLFLHEGSETGDIAKTLSYGRNYIKIMMPGLIPFVITQAYTSTLREASETLLSMKAGIAAVIVNLVFNYILIFGHFGAPALGVEGAAIATVLSRFVECGIVVAWSHKHKEKLPFFTGAYSDFTIPRPLIKKIIITGFPLFINEAMWSGGTAMLVQCYSVRGLAVIAGYNISSIIFNVLSVVFISLAVGISIIIGQQLGAAKTKEAKETLPKLIFFSVVSSLFIGIIMAIIAPFFPYIYNTTNEVRKLASDFILITAIAMPFTAFTFASYFTLRSGGKTFITFLFDSVFLWTFNLPVAFCLTRFTSINIIPIFMICQSLEIIKCVIGYLMLKKGVWINNVIAGESVTG